MFMSNKEIEIDENAHIPTSEIESDIADTEREIQDLQDEEKVLLRNPIQNKVRLYMIGGHISSRRTFIQKLQKIIEARTI